MIKLFDEIIEKLEKDKLIFEREIFEYELVNGRELINNILDKMNELEGE